MISLIVTMDRAGLIGAGDKLPWDVVPGSKWFAERVSKARGVIMGRKTFEAVKKTKWGILCDPEVFVAATKNRKGGLMQVILQKDKPDSKLITTKHRSRSIRKADEIIQGANAKGNESLIIGGASLYAQSLGVADKAYVTVLEGDFQGDKYFQGGIERFFDWKMTDYHSGKDYTRYTFEKHKKVKKEDKTKGWNHLLGGKAEKPKREPAMEAAMAEFRSILGARAAANNAAASYAEEADQDFVSLLDQL